MRKNRFIHLGVETLCLLALLVVIFNLQHHDATTEAASSGLKLDTDTILKQAKVQKLSGSVDDLDNVINDQLEAHFGKTAQELSANMSKEDAIKTAREATLGIYSPDVEGSPINMVGDQAKMMSELVKSQYLGAAASLSSMNAKFMNDQTKELVDKMENINDQLTKFNTSMKDIVKLQDSFSSKLPKLAIK